METKMLSCRLTDTELLERGQKVAELLRQIAEIEDEKKAANSDFKARLEEREGEARSLGYEIRTKAELREVSVSRTIDDVRGVEETYRDDTGEVIATRALSPQELAERKQGKLELLPGAETDAK